MRKTYFFWVLFIDVFCCKSLVYVHRTVLHLVTVSVTYFYVYVCILEVEDLIEHALNMLHHIICLISMGTDWTSCNICMVTREKSPVLFRCRHYTVIPSLLICPLVSTDMEKLLCLNHPLEGIIGHLVVFLGSIFTALLLLNYGCASYNQYILNTWKLTTN